MRRAPVIATWLLRHFGCSPQTEHVIGDLVERYEQGRSRMWYWRQVAIAVVVSVSEDIWAHKLLAMRGLILGWIVFWAFYDGLIDYAFPIFSILTGSLFEKLSAILAMDNTSFGNSPLYAFEALVTLGVFITGAVSGSVIALLHQRKVSVVLLLAVFVLVDWIILGITKRPESVGVSAQYFCVNVAMMTVGIVMGGALCRSHHGPTGPTDSTVSLVEE